MTSVSSATSSPLISQFPSGSSGTPAPTTTSSSNTDSPQLQNTQSAINEVDQIPDQLKQQAHNWATQELSHLLNVLHVVLETNPSSTQALKDLAKGISSDAKDITGQNGNSSAANPFTPLVASGQSANVTEIDISLSVSQTTVSISSDNGDSSSPDDDYFQSDSQSIDVEVEVSTVSGDLQSSPETYAHDVTLLSQASTAIGQIKATLQKSLQGQHGNGAAQQAANKAGNDISDSLNGLIGDAVDALLASPSGSLAGNLPGTFNLTA